VAGALLRDQILGPPAARRWNGTAMPWIFQGFDARGQVHRPQDSAGTEMRGCYLPGTGLHGSDQSGIGNQPGESAPGVVTGVLFDGFSVSGKAAVRIQVVVVQSGRRFFNALAAHEQFQRLVKQARLAECRTAVRPCRGIERRA